MRYLHLILIPVLSGIVLVASPVEPAAALWKPVAFPCTVRDQGLDFTLLSLEQGDTPGDEPGFRARLQVKAGGALQPQWRPTALRLHTAGKPVLEPPTIFTVPGPKLDLRFHGSVPPSEKLARLEVEFLRHEKFPPSHVADFPSVYVPRGRTSLQTYTGSTALGRIELRLAPARMVSPRAGDPTTYLEAVVTPKPLPAQKGTAGAVRPGKLHLVVVRAYAGPQPIRLLHGQTVTLTDKTEKYLFPFKLAPTDAEISLSVAVDRGRTVLFPPVKITR